MICLATTARQLGASIVFRQEDHDSQRSKAAYMSSIAEDMKWLGFPEMLNTWLQSSRSARYHEVLERLLDEGHAYVCRCTRSHYDAGRYSGTCRELGLKPKEGYSIRFKLPKSPIIFRELSSGPIRQLPFLDGDFVLKDRLGQFTYQLAVTVDDLDQDINLIVRGVDLQESTGRQLALRAALAPNRPQPLFYHHPLILDSTGRKLGKRFGSEAISTMRAAGKSASEVIALALDTLYKANASDLVHIIGQNELSIEQVANLLVEYRA
jgi:glutamyl-tRNA synthetase/glutamyl-Q tRNA(Asp) synthetase